MKKFVMTATQLNDLEATIDKLTPAQIAAALPEMNALEANRITDKILRKFHEVNSEFVTECDRTLKENLAITEKYQKEYAEKEDGLSEEEERKLGSELTAKMRAEIQAVDKASTANELAPKPVEIKLGDDEHKALKALLPASVGGWINHEGKSCRDLFVKAADVVEGAEDVE